MSVIEREPAVPTEVEQLVALRLANETYGVDISKVHGIILMQQITRIPRSPDFVAGVTNLRGKVIPVVDLRKRFGLEVTEPTKETRIVIVEIADQAVGMIVDAVTEVLRIAGDAIEPPSQIAAGVGSEYIRGIGKLADRLVVVLDIDKALGGRDLAAAQDPGAIDCDQAGAAGC